MDRGVMVAGAALLVLFLFVAAGGKLEKQWGWSRWLFRFLGLLLGASYSLLGLSAVLTFYTAAVAAVGIDEWFFRQDNREQSLRLEEERTQMLAAWAAEDAERTRRDRIDG